jgi:hypothetical protein
MQARRQEADEFYAAVIPSSLSADAANVMRQALAGMLWSKQFYYYDVDRWLTERGADPAKPNRRAAPRNDRWHHMYNAEILSIAGQVGIPVVCGLGSRLPRPRPHPGGRGLRQGAAGPDSQGELPASERTAAAYEWNFGDVNPPVHAWATLFTYRLEQTRRGHGDVEWLERTFHKLMLNFTWWVNRKDRSGNNVFEGGFLGLDNIGVFDRSAPRPNGRLPGAGRRHRLDGPLLPEHGGDASDLTLERPAYLDMTVKFAEHFSGSPRRWSMGARSGDVG